MRPHPPTVLRRLAAVALCALAGLGAAAARGDDLDTVRHAIGDYIRDEMKSHDVVGLSVALVADGRLAWAEGFGWADRERRVPARADTLYVTGGMTQAFTAAAALQLAEQGALDLDQPLRRYLPEFSIRTRFPDGPPITPRNLLTHHAGLPAMHFHGMWGARPEPFGALVARLKDEYAAYPPDTVYVPSFPGYDVLGRLIETKCGAAYADCLERRLLGPLGMTRSTFDAARADPLLLARHYWQDKPVPYTAMRDVPAGGLVSSVTELAHFAQMLLDDGRYGGRALLRARGVSEMFRPQNAQVALDLDNRVGLPWRLAGVRFPEARTAAWLGNESPFARGRLLLVPEHRLGVIVLTNCSGSSEAAERISTRLMQLALQGRKPAAPPEPRVTALTAPSPARTRADIEGRYATLVGQIDVHAADGRYRAQMLGKTLELVPTPEGLLAPEYRFLGLIPIPISVLRELRFTEARVAGRDIAIAYYRNQAYRLGEKIAPRPLPPAWRARLGEYRVVNDDALLKLVNLRDVTLAYDGGVLYFRYRVPGWLGLVANIPVRPVSDAELVVEGTGWLMGETIALVEESDAPRLRYSGYMFRRVAPP